MRIRFLLERGSPPRANPVIEDTIRILSDAGAEVDISYPEEELIGTDVLRVEADLYLLKSDTELSLSLASALELLGARVINSVEACSLCRNKIVAATVLAEAGLPIPRSFACSDPMQLARIVTEMPLIFKPYRGYHGAGIRIAEGEFSLPSPGLYPDVVFAQEYLKKSRMDLKVFGIGREVFGVRKPFSADSFLETGVPCELPREIEDLARGTASAFGLELYGLDIAESERGAYVIDVNYFPGYRGVPEASERLARFILSAAGN